MNIQDWNNKVLKSKGINASVRPYSRVRSLGDLKKARLWDDTVVERTESIYVDGQGLVKCAPYELHFIYETPKEHKGWGLMCTCGSIAGVVGMNDYSMLASPTDTGKMIVCIRHTTLKQKTGIGQHADDSTE